MSAAAAEPSDVLVIGAGVAGLAAAQRLAAAGLSVCLLEARDRLGGRILTLRAGSDPIELGAELVHGKRRTLEKLAPRAELTLERVHEAHWYLEAGVLVRERELGKTLRRFIKAAKQRELDALSVSEALVATRRSARDARLIASFVSGLHAAHPERYGVAQLFDVRPTNKRPSGTKLFRVTDGYDRLIAGLHDERVRVLTGVVVRDVEWSPERVRARAASGSSFEARRAIVTLPLGVLRDTRAVRFRPEISDHRAAARELEVGNVVRAVLDFDARFWDAELGFLHGPGLPFPTFWPSAASSNARLVGWASAQAAEALAGASENELRDAAVDSLAELTGAARDRIAELLLRFHVKDWQADPFSRGAYSYGRAGAKDAWQRLARALDDTLYFAGEATNTDGDDATVHGALATGLRAADEILSRARP